MHGIMRVREGLFWCICADRAVFLDIEQDQYFTLPHALQGAFQSWAAGGDPGEAALQRLLRCNILASGPGECDPHPLSLVPIRRDYGARTGSSSAPTARGNLLEVARAALAQHRAETALRRFPLAQVLADLPKAPSRLASLSRDVVDGQRIGAAFATTAQMMRSADKCLPRALAAWRLCVRRGLRPVLAFGVRMDPFAAHCWIQLGDAVVVGDLEQVRLFTPIMSVACDHVTS
ncbi:hypothetical protein LH128_01002 [Sphingomonas sp. LH128]|nr:hypothetical protein LH128_01002 [Sphingomonas sp. LH128]